ncbi:MAG: phosphoglycerate kinase [Alphaproteobacteria bacterium]|nr:phosphoglycerate kinase [Alphaproteobacteria bacterium]
MAKSLRTVDQLDVRGKRVLCRVDLNVPMKNSRIEDLTRVKKLIPTLEYLIHKKAKVIVLSHFGRPDGEFVRDCSLAPLADALSASLGGKTVNFAVDCIGPATEEAVAKLKDGEVLLLENLRFHKGETANSPAFVEKLARLGDLYVDDAFSCSHRKHASIVGLAKALPSAAGLLLQEEIENLEKILQKDSKPILAIVGGSKVSTKLELLENLMDKVDAIMVGGAMANTFLLAKGIKVEKSLVEKDLLATAQIILEKAKTKHCRFILPEDVIVAKELVHKATCRVVSAEKIPAGTMILDIGPKTVATISDVIAASKFVVWNGPLGAFEIQPFDVGTSAVARIVAQRTAEKQLVSVAGGGDIVSALSLAGLKDEFSYISTAGGAFLEWLEGKELPGVAVLRA